ncbi:MAG: putative glycosyltransferase, partial [Phenylobacterium sp.]|nr:putative glycosyltransferase [Phenylobacterium sp.]
RLWGYRQVFKRTRKVWTLSAQESAEMRAEFPDLPDLFEDVINPYVTEEMLAPPVQAPPAAGPKTVISIARLTRQKRLDRLIAAFAQVSDRSARLKILGEGEDRASLAAQVAELGLADRVAMPGYVADVARELHRAHVFVLTSEYEGLPAAVLEAMAANCAVLSTDCFPAARAMLADRPGCGLIEDTAPAAIAELIDRRLAQPRPEHLRQFAQGYSVENGVASHISALSALL